MRTQIRYSAVLLVSACLGGCATHVVPKPANIRLDSALVSVSRGLQAMQEAHGEMLTGLLPSEVKVVFNVSATAEDQLSLEQTPIRLVSGGTSYETARGNTITVTFTNLLYASNSTVIGAKDPEALATLINTLKRIIWVGK